MVKTITIKIANKSENVEGIIKNIMRLYKEEIKSFRIIDKKPKK